MLELSLNLILFLNLWYTLTLEHYIPPPKFCLFAQTCNHTWIPICGVEINLKHNRMFLDECDMFEYNCDNQKAYFPTGIDNNCSDETVITSNNTTQSSPMEHTSTNDTSKSTVDTSITTEMTTTKIATLIQETASDVTTEDITNLTDSITQTTITSELTISETNTAQTTNATLSTIQTTNEEPKKILTSDSKNVANKTKSILTSCTARPFNVTIPQNNLDTNFSSSTYTTEEITITISSTPSSSQKDIPFVETTTTTSETQTSFNPAACEIYPKHCDRPITWETTLKGETRDFFQILKARFGNRFRILEDTTHWPRRATPHINDVEDAFQFDHHIKGKEFD